MENSRIDPVGLLVAMAAVTLAFSAAQMNFGYLSTLAGLTLLLVLFGYDRQGYRSGLQSLAFAFVCGACLVLALGYVLRVVSSSGAASDAKPNPPAFEEWLSITWLVGTAVFWGIDRARMGARQQEQPVYSGGGHSFLSQPVPELVRQPAPEPVPQPAPEPAAQRLPQLVRAPVYSPTVVEPSVAPVSVPVAPAPVPVAPRGKEATIYVNLVGEGMNMLRAVRAEAIGRDFYLIADEMPEGEEWEFKPGQIVRCKKKNLSSGKALVAFEEAPRA